MTNKTILMTLLIIPLFIAGIGIVSFQNAHAGIGCGDPIPSVDPAVIDVTLQPGQSHEVPKVFEPNNEGCDFVGFAEPPFIQAQECFDSGFDTNIVIDVILDDTVEWTETITVNEDAAPGRYHCPIIWQLQYFDDDLNGFADNVFGDNGNGGIFFTKTVTQKIWITVPDPRPDEGCTPGFWKQAQHLGHWAPTGLSPGDTLASLFFITQATPEASLLEALSLKGGKGIAGAEHTLFRIAVAALLNAAHPDVNYPLTADEVLTYVRIALEQYDRETILELKDMFDEANNAVCPLEGQSPEPPGFS